MELTCPHSHIGIKPGNVIREGSPAKISVSVAGNISSEEPQLKIEGGNLTVRSIGKGFEFMRSNQGVTRVTTYLFEVRGDAGKYNIKGRYKATDKTLYETETAKLQIRKKTTQEKALSLDQDYIDHNIKVKYYYKAYGRVNGPDTLENIQRFAWVNHSGSAGKKEISSDMMVKEENSNKWTKLSEVDAVKGMVPPQKDQSSSIEVAPMVKDDALISAPDTLTITEPDALRKTMAYSPPIQRRPFLEVPAITSAESQQQPRDHNHDEIKGSSILSGNNGKQLGLNRKLFFVCSLTLSIVLLLLVVWVVFEEGEVDQPKVVALPKVLAQSKIVVKEQLSLEKIYEESIKSVVIIETESGFGSGFIVHRDGYIVTNWHVVEGVKLITVKLNGSNIPIRASLERRRKYHDLALLKIDLPSSLNVLNMGRFEDVSIGERVAVIGSPEGLSGTITDGIVSQKRELRGTNYIQTNAAINPGNSGGPIISLKTGKVIGVATLKSAMQNVNFGVSTEHVKDLINLN